MMHKILRIRDRLVLYKIYLMRTLSYVSIFNSIMIMFLAISGLREYGVEIDLKVWFAPIVIVGTTGLIFVGWLEDRLGGYRKENQLRTERTPQFGEILKHLEDLKKDVEELKKRK